MDTPKRSARCPNCNVLLEPYQYRTLTVDVCPLCHGMWLDRGELGALVGYFEAEVRDQSGGMPKRQVVPSGDLPPGHRGCPRCGVMMASFNYAYDSNIILDRCSVCQGVWVDRGELHKIVLHAWHAAQGNL